MRYVQVCSPACAVAYRLYDTEWYARIQFGRVLEELDGFFHPQVVPTTWADDAKWVEPDPMEEWVHYYFQCVMEELEELFHPTPMLPFPEPPRPPWSDSD